MSRSVPVLSDAGGDYVEVTCGVLEGKLYFDMLKDCTGGQLGSVKCIVHNDSHVTPGEFEQKGGKTKAKNWKNPFRTKVNPC